MLSDLHRTVAQEALDRARDLQIQFWDAARDLEQILGVEIDGTADLENLEIDDLIASEPQE